MQAHLKPDPTTEQSAICDFISSQPGNLIVNALAGTGKTTTLDMINAASKQQPVLCLAFNKKIAEEMKGRFPSTTTVRTFNSLGHRIWSKAHAKNLTLNPKKTQEQFKAHIEGWKKDAQREAWEVYWEVVGGVGFAKSLGYIPDGVFPNAKRLIQRDAFHVCLDEKPSPLVEELIDALLITSIKSAYEGYIDYNDQIYMPALFGGTYPRFPHVMVDEGQDLSPVNHAMLKKLVTGRVSVVGDRYQSIYAFRGAVTAGMAQLERQFSAKALDLSVSFRCPRAIVEYVHWRVPHFKWKKDGGHVAQLRNLLGRDTPDDSTIICRNNAPLFRVAFNLLSCGRSVHVAGSDIGPKLVGLLKRLGDADLSRPAVLGAIEEWRSERLEKGSSSAHDLADAMRVFAEHGEDLGQAIAYAEHLFAQKGRIRLLTGHKAKGLEFDTVYHLDPWLLREDEQDLNLRYVISTRARKALYEIDSRNIRW